MPKSRIGQACRALAVVATLLSPSTLAAVDFASAVSFVSAPDELSEEFLRQSQEAWSSVPENIWHGIKKAGWQVQLAQFIADAVPELKHDHPRGWPADFTWDHTDAVNLPKTRVLVLAEKRRRRNGDIVLSDRVAGVFRHELGHAFDMVSHDGYRFRSSSPRFLAAYESDIAVFSSDDREELAYYLQGNRAGRQETFAEAFAVLLGGGSDVTKAERFQQAFPSVLGFLRTSIDEYAP